MDSFRQFEASDVFGRKWQVLFKWMQTAISLRHADTVDVKFVLTAEDGTRVEKTLAMPHAQLLQVSKSAGHELTDPWCSRLAAKHLAHILSTGEDLEKNLVTIPPEDLERWAREIQNEEQAAIHKHA